MSEIRISGPLSRELQEFYNHSHDKNGKFTTGKGGGAVRGGYLDSKEQSVVDSADPSSQEALNWIFETRKEVAPTYSDGFQHLAEQYGGHMEGLEHQLKSPESVQNRVERNIRDNHLSPKEAVEDLGDSVRYTMVFPDDQYEAGVRNTVGVLKNAGVGFERVMNSWAPGDQYDGINAGLRDPRTGLKIELQFHTNDSYAVKDALHKHYEYIRDRNGTNEDRFQAWKQMADMSDQTARPPGINNLYGDVEGVNFENKTWPWKKLMIPGDETSQQLARIEFQASPLNKKRAAVAAKKYKFPLPTGKGLAPFKSSSSSDSGTPKKKYDVTTIKSWEEAEELFKAGTIDQSGWEDFVNYATGGMYDDQ